jgi:Tol biopolymer transport system component
LLLAAASAGQATTRVSVDSAGRQGNGGSNYPAVSPDARYVAFDSLASNLVPGDTNDREDIFVHDRATGVTERVSVDSSGNEGNGNSWHPAISADGQIVAFESDSANLIPDDTNGGTDVFVHDRSTGVTVRVSVDSAGVEGNLGSYAVSITPDGRIVAFESWATNLVPGDSNDWNDVFVHDRSTGLTERVSVDSLGQQSNRSSDEPSISADGLVVTFSSSATNLVPGDTNGWWDVFVHERSTGTTQRISVNSSSAEGNGDSDGPALSADGRYVAFESHATNLVPGDTNGWLDVFVHDRLTGITERVSVNSSGVEANRPSDQASISADGQFVTFESDATNLGYDRPFALDCVYLHDRLAWTTELASVDSFCRPGPGGSASLSADGQTVAFHSESTRLVPDDTNGRRDVFVHERGEFQATWSNYGAGYPGTTGVPSITPSADPELGKTVTVDVGNSFGVSTFGLLFLGPQRTQIPSVWGGDLLVLPEFTVPIHLPSTGFQLSGDIVDDIFLSGTILCLQVIESDSGATHGVSFTPGLELIFGR